MTERWQPDLLPGFEQRRLDLPDAELAPGEEQPVSAVLVRASKGKAAKRALLYLHGWNDYFFQTHLADFFIEQGFAFYALELRRYGRARTPDQLPGFITDLDHYSEELNIANELIQASHDSLVVMGHSTGGLVAVLWADQTQPALAGVILNSPWLDLQAAQAIRALGAPIVAGIGARNPTTVLRLPDSGFYGRSLHVDSGGEWDYDRELKSSPGPPIRAGWLAAILAGHDRVAAGLNVPCPVLVLASDKTDFRRRWSEELKTADVVLDVDQIAARAIKLGRNVTLIRIAGGMHDLTLSAEPTRSRTFAEMRRWLRGYVVADQVSPPGSDGRASMQD